jgi:hypothetical protein
MYMASNLNVRHDRWRWLAWAWINCVCFSLEIVFGQWFFAEGKRPDGSSRGSGIRRTIRSSRYYRLIAAMAATCNIMYVTSHFLNARNAARAFVILAILVALVFATMSIIDDPHHCHYFANKSHGFPDLFLQRPSIRKQTSARIVAD